MTQYYSGKGQGRVGYTRTCRHDDGGGLERITVVYVSVFFLLFFVGYFLSADEVKLVMAGQRAFSGQFEGVYWRNKGLKMPTDI